MDLYKSVILSKENIIKYCKKYEIKINARGATLILTCPYCGQLTSNLVGQTHLIDCQNINCFRHGNKYTLISIVKRTEKDKSAWDNEKILEYLKDLFKVKIKSAKDIEEINKWFDRYEKEGFSLVPVRHNDKASDVEKEWQIKEHRSKQEWNEWLSAGLNMGLNCGLSKKLVIDIDMSPIPEEINKLTGNTLIQRTTRGWHLFYNQNEELPKTLIGEFTLVDQTGKEIFINNPNTNIKIGNKNKTLRTMELEEKGILKIAGADIEVTLKKYLKIDIETNGGQVVIFPSIVNDIPRNFINENPIIDIPPDFVTYLKSKIKSLAPQTTDSEILKQELVNETYKRALLCEGDGRHDYIFKIGCMFRKQLSLPEVEFILGTFNKVSCQPPLDYKEMKNIFNSIKNYQMYDDKEIARDIYEHLKEVTEATHRDIERTIVGDNRLCAEEKTKIDKTLAYLVKEGLIQKRGNLYIYVHKLEWKTNLIENSKPLPFKVPYFHDLGHFNFGDVLVIGGMYSVGKTHIALNIVKQLVNQNIKPYYISLETGSRFAKIGLQLGLTEHDFYHAFCYDPTKIELENNAITIIDWLNPSAFKDTHVVFGHFAQQLDKHGGLLIIFVQLKEDGSFFAPNLINLFPALSCKYFYEKDTNGSSGYFEINKIRESIRQVRVNKIPCRYNWDTKELLRIDEIKEDIKETNNPLTEKKLDDGKEEG